MACNDKCMHGRRNDLVVALGLIAASLPTVAAGVRKSPGAGYITIAGYVTEATAGAFTVDYDGLHVHVDMASWGWKQDYEAFDKRRVVVSGPLRGVDFKARSLQPDTLWVGGLDIYYRRKDDSSITSYVMRDPPDTDFAFANAVVRSSERLQPMDSRISVDSSHLSALTRSQLRPGQRVQVEGHIDAKFWTTRTLSAERIEPVGRVGE
jgi:hypothetical protein